MKHSRQSGLRGQLLRQIRVALSGGQPPIRCKPGGGLFWEARGDGTLSKAVYSDSGEGVAAGTGSVPKGQASPRVSTGQTHRTSSAKKIMTIISSLRLSLLILFILPTG